MRIPDQFPVEIRHTNGISGKVRQFAPERHQRIAMRPFRPVRAARRVLVIRTSTFRLHPTVGAEQIRPPFSAPRGWSRHPGLGACGAQWRCFWRIVPRRFALSSLGLTLAILPLPMRSAPAEENWPQWRGPLQSGVAPTANPPTEWSETNHVRWKVRIPGQGTATPIIWENQVFVQTAIPTDRKAEAPERKADPAGADDRAKPDAGPRRRGGGGGMMSSEKPDKFYQFVVLCLDRATGKMLWQKVAREEVPHEGHRANDGSFAAASPEHLA